MMVNSEFAIDNKDFQTDLQQIQAKVKTLRLQKRTYNTQQKETIMNKPRRGYSCDKYHVEATRQSQIGIS